MAGWCLTGGEGGFLCGGVCGVAAQVASLCGVHEAFFLQNSTPLCVHEQRKSIFLGFLFKNNPFFLVFLLMGKRSDTGEVKCSGNTDNT